MSDTRRITLKLKKEHFNSTYLPFISDFRFTQIFYGGGGSGKSVFVAQKIIFNIIQSVGFNVMVIRNVSRDNHDTTFQQLSQIIRIWNLSEYFTINRAKGQEEIKCIINNNKIIFKGLDGKAENRKGTTFDNGCLCCIWVEEASEVLERDFNQLIVRLRGKLPAGAKFKKHIIMSFNPIDKDHWLKARFFDRPIKEQDGFVLKTTYKDNEHLEEDDKKHLEGFKDIDEYYYQVYCLGEWGDISTARVFHNIVISDFDYTADNLENVCYGMDFGYDHASTLMSVGFRDGDIYIFDEAYAKGRTNTQWIKYVEDTLFNKHNLIVADGAEPDRIEEFNNAGFDVVRAKKGADSVRNGVDFLRNGTIYIHESNCPNAAREFSRFKNRETTSGIVRDKYVELDDDTIAGVRYAVEHLWHSQEAISVDVSILAI